MPMREIRTEIVVEAPAERVWSVLTGFGAYPQWNPFIREAEGAIQEGSRLRVRIAPPGGRSMTFTPTVTHVASGQSLRWLGRLFVPKLFDGEHVFEIEPLGGRRVRFVHRERFSGLLVPLLWRRLDRDTRAGFEAMNAALKARAEDAGA